MCFRPRKFIWHGSDSSGNTTEVGNCESWTSEDSQKQGYGSSLVTTATYRPKLLDQTLYSCHNSFVVLCVEHKHYNPVYRKRRSEGEEFIEEQEEYENDGYN